MTDLLDLSRFHDDVLFLLPCIAVIIYMRWTRPVEV